MKNRKKNTTSSLSILNIAGVLPYQERPNEIYMNNTQLLHFKCILDTWYKQLKNDIQKTTFHIQNENLNFPDPIDRAVQEEEFNIELRNRDRERKLIKKIENTLHKIKNNNFGYCNLCDVEIGIKRLEANPIADLCIDCKTLAEIKEKQMTG